MICGNSRIHLQSYCVPAVLDPSTPGEDANRGHPTTLLTSVELPRWIDHPSVDSRAMLSAFLAYTGRSTEEAREQVKYLYMIVHEHESTFVKDNEVIQPQELESANVAARNKVDTNSDGTTGAGKTTTCA